MGVLVNSSVSLLYMPSGVQKAPATDRRMDDGDTACASARDGVGSLAKGMQMIRASDGALRTWWGYEIEVRIGEFPPSL